jgi:ribbon-helix-helix CopG family protein
MPIAQKCTAFIIRFRLTNGGWGAIWNLMKRSIVVNEKQNDWLEQEAGRLGITVSELIRRIIDQYREDRK